MELRRGKKKADETDDIFLVPIVLRLGEFVGEYQDWIIIYSACEAKSRPGVSVFGQMQHIFIGDSCEKKKGRDARLTLYRRQEIFKAA